MRLVCHPERDGRPDVAGRGRSPQVSRWRHALHRTRRPTGWISRNARYLWMTRIRARRRVRSAGALVDAQWYLERYPDVRAAGTEPIRPFFRFRGPEGGHPNPPTRPHLCLDTNPPAPT